MTAVPVAMAGAVLVSACGEDPGALLEATVTGEGGIVRGRGATVPRAGDALPVSILMAPVPDVDEPGDGRIQALVERALEGLLDQAPPPERARLHLVLPPGDAPRGRGLDLEALRRHLCAEPAVEDLAPVLQAQAGPVAGHLEAACAALAAGEADEVVFGAADSLLDPATMGHLAARGLLETGEGTGVVPGEAAVLVRLRRAHEAPGTPVLAGAVLREEAGAGRPHAARHDALAEAVRGVRALGGPPGVVIHGAGVRRLRLMEWHQVRDGLWPPAPPGSPVGPPAPEPETLNLGLAVGEVGAALLPLGLVLARAWLQAAGPAPAGVAVACEWEEGPGRAAVALRAVAGAGDEHAAPGAGDQGQTP